MSLREHTLFGVTDKVQLSIDRLREFCPPEGYYVAFSGGKDSQCILELCRQAGVKHDAHMALTTVDPPEVIRFVKQHYPEVELIKPAMSMYQLIVKKGLPPTRVVRYCCDVLKEPGGNGRFVVTGVRWEESARRAKRRLVESCYRHGKKRLLHPIIEWKTSDVWEYLTERGIPHCSLYDEGFTRIGCIMCPCASQEKVLADAARWPNIARLYRNACREAFEISKAQGKRRDSHWRNGDDMYEWWSHKNDRSKDEPLLESLFDEWQEENVQQREGDGL